MDLAKKQAATQSQKLMVFVLTMALYGLATLFTELIPKFQVGIVEFSVEYFLFIPLTLAMLFDPLSAALGAATGELVFSEIMLGQFGGLGELETVVDICKVQFAVEDFEAVAGLPESVFATEGFAFANDLLFSGILFCMLPTMYLVPKLYGKIEPLLGMRPRDGQTSLGGLSPKMIRACVIGFVAAVASALIADGGLPLIDWEADWAESGAAFSIGMVVAAALAVAAILVIKIKARSGESVEQKA